MSHDRQETQGTGLRDVFDILVKTPRERLLSLTFQLGDCPEDNIIHALCLIVLQKKEQALDKLQMLKDNYLAKCLVEKWQKSEGMEDFSDRCSDFQDFTQECLAGLARIFNILSQQRLCDPSLRNLAYKRALSSDDQRISSSENLDFDQLREEAKSICGPQVVEWVCSPTDLKSGSHHDLYRSQDREIPTLKVSLTPDLSDSAHREPSPLQASSSMPSYPTHLEISVPPTALFPDDRRSPQPSDQPQINTPVHFIGETEVENSSGQLQTSVGPQIKSSELSTLIVQKHPGVNETRSMMEENLITETQNTKRRPEASFTLPSATCTSLPQMSAASQMHESTSAEEEEEEETFYAFVIMHAPEDEDMAESMKERLEAVIKNEGAVFSNEFATPGKTKLSCLEDAINNTAFTILLLTRNFNNLMQEMETNTALLNSVDKTHKYNTVIPLLPRENCMPRESISPVLRTIVPLKENDSFVRKIQKFMTPATIKRQRDIWIREQTVKKQKERQMRLKQRNEHQKQFIREGETLQSLEREELELLMTRQMLLTPISQAHFGAIDGRAPWQQQPNIHINNARYIMIGDGSQMTVDMGDGMDRDNSEDREETQ
ncbi:uncharacterized protein V6R79_002588 [Siganus canaliculatus]